MASNGRPVELTFTPAVGGILTVTCSFSAEGSGSDWGAGKTGSPFCEQGGTTAFDGSSPLGNARLPYTLIGKFVVVSGSLVKFGLYGAVTGASAVTFHDAQVVAEFTPS